MALKLRVWHSYLGMFIAPMILFFALSGCLQLFNLHESREGYTAPRILQRIGRLHKDQVFEPVHPHKAAAPPPEAAGAAPAAPKPPETMPLKVMLLKWLFCFEALALATTTVIGVTIGLRQPARAKSYAIVLVAGIVIPLLLVVI